MRTSQLLWLASIFCLVSLSASAQQTASTSSPPATSDPQAVSVIQKSLAALTGGLSVSDVTLTGSARRIAGSDDETGTATLTATAAGDSKLSLNFPSGPRTEIRNHSALPLPGSLPPGVPASVAQTAQPVGAWSGSDGALHGIASQNVMTAAVWFFPALTLTSITSSPSYVLSYVGQETRDGATVLHVSAVEQFPQLATVSAPTPVPPGPIMQHLSQMDFYLDPQSLLPVAADFAQHPDGNELADIAVEIRFSDYQAVSGGFAVPMHIQKYLNDNLTLDLQLSDAALNSGLSASAFALQ